ncbi:VWA domain-containing protein [Nocardioides renjunii]|uniref:VWA domain-containing protein n=1 Tax=Nocardioides renjunii TaxID=3095075 RepID=UPI002AFF9703|nr:VWA domain-containing protein [Nocardioides sp. S-34]WQQ23337.1 VWA domain-containing protein [Nocardioides sp. S-34]
MQNNDERGSGRARMMSTAVLATVVMVTGLVVGAGATWLAMARPGSEAAAPGCDRFRTVDVAVAPAIYGVVVTALEEATPACTSVEPAMRSGIDVAQGVSMGGALPDIWIPEARYLTTAAHLGPAARPELRLGASLATTPVLLVGGTQARRFGSWGDAEASKLVSVPDPASSVSGALAVTAPEAEARAVGRSRVDAREMLVPFAQAYGARRVRGADDTVRPAMFARRSPRLVVTTEQELLGVPDRDDLRDLTPGVGSPALDFPLTVRRDAAPGARALARALRAHLATEEGRRLVAAEGLRAPGAAGKVLPTPSGEAISRAVRSWGLFSVPSSMLAVVDASGSMDADAGTGSRMDLLADASRIGLSFLPDHARVGLWVFSIDQGGPGQDWRELEPMRRLDDLRFGRTQRYALRERADQMSALTDGGTGLYDTALAAYREAVRRYRPHYSNAVVLMTDGRNEDPGSIELEPLLQRLEELRDPERPVRMVGIAISGDADLAALRRMAQVTGGEAYLAAEPEDVLEVFAQAVLSR